MACPSLLGFIEVIKTVDASRWRKDKEGTELFEGRTIKGCVRSIAERSASAGLKSECSVMEYWNVTRPSCDDKYAMS